MRLEYHLGLEYDRSRLTVITRDRRAVLLGVARFIDASIYRDTFPAIVSRYYFLQSQFLFVFFPHNFFYLGRKYT